MGGFWLNSISYSTAKTGTRKTSISLIVLELLGKIIKKILFPLSV